MIVNDIEDNTCHVRSVENYDHLLNNHIYCLEYLMQRQPTQIKFVDLEYSQKFKHNQHSEVVNRKRTGTQSYRFYQNYNKVD